MFRSFTACMDTTLVVPKIYSKIFIHVIEHYLWTEWLRDKSDKGGDITFDVTEVLTNCFELDPLRLWFLLCDLRLPNDGEEDLSGANALPPTASAG